MRKASAYVFAAAALERACKEALTAVLREINAAALPPEKLRASLFVLHCAGDLDSIAGGSRRSLKRHNRAVDMFETVFSAVPVPLATVLPLDGRTPRAKQFETIWRVFGFVSTPMPHPACSLALEDLADGRNEIAHGEVDPVVFGKAKPLSDVGKLVKRAEDVLLHLFACADDYLAHQRFLR